MRLPITLLSIFCIGILAFVASEPCGDKSVGRLVVTATGLTGTETFTLKLNDNAHVISKNGGNVSLPSGIFNVQVEPVSGFTSSADKAVINVVEKQDYSLAVTFTAIPVVMTPVTFSVNWTQGTTPSPLPTATIIGRNYDEGTQLASGSNTIQLPNRGSFTITPADYAVEAITHTANSITVTDGEVVGTDTITYAAQSPGATPSRIMAGYVPVSWHEDVKISDAAKKGYNVVLPAFIVINNDEPIKFTENVFKAYTGWGPPFADHATSIAKIKADIELAKASHNLKYVIASVGGQHNTYDPRGATAAALASKTADFLRTYGMDGIDFDLEVIKPYITEQSI
eukprot:Platyproteum_vivax@DN15142_c0_g1_i1.p1